MTTSQYSPKMYKYYLIYINSGTDSWDITGCPEDNAFGAIEKFYGLYAYTTDKEVLDLFRSQRRDDMFIYKKVLLNREDVNNLIFRFTLGVLEKHSLTSIDEEPAYIATSQYEWNSVIQTSQLVRMNLYRIVKNNIPTTCFKSKYQELLRVTGITQDKNFYDECGVDIVNVFINLYGETLKGGS